VVTPPGMPVKLPGRNRTGFSWLAKLASRLP
jgi:hypothetical protein